MAGKGFARLRTEAEGALVLMCSLSVLMCSLSEKQALLDSGDAAYFSTPHDDGYGAILVDLERVDRRQPADLIDERGIAGQGGGR